MSEPEFMTVKVARFLPPTTDIRDRTDPSYRDFLDRLVADLKERAVQVPLIAEVEGEFLRIRDGETRRQACLLAGRTDAPALVYRVKLAEGALLVAQLQANAMRHDMTDVEYARTYLEIMNKEGIAAGELSRRLKVPASVVSKRLKVVSRIPADMLSMIGEGDGRVPFSTAHALSALDDEQKVRENMTRAANGLLTRDAAVALVQGEKMKRKPKAKPVKARSPKGLVAIIPPLDAEGIIAEFNALIEAVRRCVKNGLPLSSIPQLLKGA